MKAKKNKNMKALDMEIKSLLIGIAESLQDYEKTCEETAAIYRMAGGIDYYGASARYMAATENKSLIALESLTKSIVSRVAPNKRTEKLWHKHYYQAFWWYIDKYMRCEYHHIKIGRKVSKEFFLKKNHVEFFSENWYTILIKYQTHLDKDRFEFFILTKKHEWKLKFLNEKGTYFKRVSESEFEKMKEKNKLVVTLKEMCGKYGWFEAGNYRLPIYYTGYILSEDDYAEYIKTFD